MLKIAQFHNYDDTCAMYAMAITNEKSFHGKNPEV